MKSYLTIGVAVLGLILSLTLIPAEGADTGPTDTVLTIEGMHCEGCAQKIARKLQKVKNVATATVSAKDRQARIVSKPEAIVSPKALWEAVEQTGYKPVKLVSPEGTFEEKPKS